MALDCRMRSGVFLGRKRLNGGGNEGSGTGGECHVVFVLFRRVNASPRDDSNFNRHRRIRTQIDIRVCKQAPSRYQSLTNNTYIHRSNTEISSCGELKRLQSITCGSMPVGKKLAHLNNQRIWEWSDNTLRINVLRVWDAIPVFFEA